MANSSVDASSRRMPLRRPPGERPSAIDGALTGMPIGSPGMDGPA